jgi:3D (Asp-Asp-Asp) domain-containing protein
LTRLSAFVIVLALTLFANIAHAPPARLPLTLNLPQVDATSPEPEPPPPPPPPTETYVITAYTVGDDYTPSHGITASGERVKAGYTAACPRELPFGTELRIEGVGRRTCTDRGGRIRGRHIDLYMTTKKAALQFGRQRLKVEIIRKGDD